MTEISQRRYAGDAHNSKEGWVSAFGVADVLHLAATPTFAAMALLTAMSGSDAHPMTCMRMAGSSPMGSMGLMYLLMSVFHAAPWVNAWKYILAGSGQSEQAARK